MDWLSFQWELFPISIFSTKKLGVGSKQWELMRIFVVKKETRVI